MGIDEIRLAPTRRDLEAFGGWNMMRRQGNERVTRIAHESAAEQLDRPSVRAALDRAREAQPA